MDPQIKKHLAAGRELYQSGDYEHARPHLEAVRDGEAGFADVHNMLGFIHYDQGRPEQARESFERALAINPLYTEAALNLAVVYNELGLYEEGRALYEKVHNSRGSGGLDQLEPLARGKIANMHADLADAYVALGLPDHAIKELQKALRVCPTFVDIRNKLAITLRDTGRLPQALDEFQAICDLSPDYVPARTHYGVTLWKMGRIAEARAQWEAVIERDPGNRGCLVYLKMTAEDAEAGAEATTSEATADPAGDDAKPRAESAEGSGETKTEAEAASDGDDDDSPATDEDEDGRAS